jgi:hypothetical protein
VPTAGVSACPVAGAVGPADVGGGDVGGPLDGGDVGGPLDGGPVGGAEVLDAGAENVLVDGDCVGVEVRFALVVGWTERVA